MDITLESSSVSSESESSQLLSVPKFSFLITTDNHMGYKEDDHIRRKDTYQAFEEALQIGRDNDVDFILLGGDLFHMNKPSANIEHKCIKIIRQHMNAKCHIKSEPSFRRISGKFSHFHKVGHANFEDPNLKVPYPIMTIHGNHDDPTGPRAQSVCEKLATCGLLNYFGALNSKGKEIIIEPIVLQKEHIKIALYGLGFIPDYKLKQAFEKKLVKFVDPPEDTYNVLVVHQNRVPFAQHKVIPDDLFPKFFHLLIRGHEHATLEPSKLLDSDVAGIVYQPGSTIATSICPSEAAPKKVGLISVQAPVECSKKPLPYKMDYKLVELKSCRSMIFKDISQKEIIKYTKKVANVKKLPASEYVRHSQNYVEQCIENLLDEWKMSSRSSEFQHQNDSNLKLPLVRIRLEYILKEERFDERDLGRKFYPNRVANSNIGVFKKQKLEIKVGGESENLTFANDDEEDELEDFDHVNLGNERNGIDDMIHGYFRDQPADKRLQALSLIEYINAVDSSGEDGNVISKVLSKKKKDVLLKFNKEILDEKVAESELHDEEAVRKWFLKTFAQNDYKKLAGDYLDSIELSD